MGFFWQKKASGKRYIEEMTRLLNEWLSGSPLRDNSFTVIR